MFWALLAHHQVVHSCIKQFSNPSIIPNVLSMYEYRDGYVQSNWNSL